MQLCTIKPINDSKINSTSFEKQTSNQIKTNIASQHNLQLKSMNKTTTDDPDTIYWHQNNTARKLIIIPTMAYEKHNITFDGSQQYKMDINQVAKSTNGQIHPHINNQTQYDTFTSNNKNIQVCEILQTDFHLIQELF
jgi:hypothetical protein